MEEKKVPALRFRGFDNAWEQRRLGEVALFNPRGELPEEFEYVDLESVIGTEMIFHRKERKETAPSRAQRLAYIGDLFYQMVRPYQKNNYLFEKRDKTYVFSTGYAQMRPCIDGYFLLSLVQDDRFVRGVLDKCTGTSYPAINSNDLADIEVAIPSNRQEDLYIAKVFRNLDHLISLHQRKLEMLKKVKKSMLEKMFPKNDAKVPEVRFSDFTDAWEQRRLGELADKVTEKNTLLAKTEVLTNSAEFGIINQREFFDHDIVNENNIGGYYIVRERDFVYNPRISVSAPVGPINCNKLGKSGVMSPLYTVFRVHDIDSVYLEYFFKTSRWHSFMRFNGDSGVRSDRFSIKTELFYKMPIPITKYCEQVKIGKYFSQLDYLISLHQRKLEKLKNIKKSMLEKMFII